VIIVVLVAVGINGCEGSARKSALRDYANSVNTVVNRSDATSKSLFDALSGKGGDSQQVSQSVNTTEATAQHLSVPSSARTAQSHLVLALRMRLDGVSAIAGQIQAALGNSVRTSAVTNIAGDMARFYASDVLYKDYTAPAIVSALHANSIAVGGADGAPVSAGQFLPSLQWLTPGYVASQLGVAISSAGSGAAAAGAGHNTSKGLHGHELDSVSVAGTTLSSAATNSVAASPAPTFTLNFTNAGDFNEFGVTCEVKVTGTSDSGTKVVNETMAGKPSSCNVTLSSPPREGATFTVVATIEKVPGEKNLANNTLSFPVTFH
jgi:ribosomal protein S11